VIVVIVVSGLAVGRHVLQFHQRRPKTREWANRPETHPQKRTGGRSPGPVTAKRLATDHRPRSGHPSRASVPPGPTMSDSSCDSDLTRDFEDGSELDSCPARSLRAKKCRCTRHRSGKDQADRRSQDAPGNRQMPGRSRRRWLSLQACCQNSCDRAWRPCSTAWSAPDN